ncbi:hypothetical protein PFISCL1PPCAC_24858, partial [Pristionchus fissidentatus]
LEHARVLVAVHLLKTVVENEINSALNVLVACHVIGVLALGGSVSSGENDLSLLTDDMLSLELEYKAIDQLHGERVGAELVICEDVLVDQHV